MEAHKSITKKTKLTHTHYNPDPWPPSRIPEYGIIEALKKLTEEEIKEKAEIYKIFDAYTTKPFFLQKMMPKLKGILKYADINNFLNIDPTVLLISIINYSLTHTDITINTFFTHLLQCCFNEDNTVLDLTDLNLTAIEIPEICSFLETYPSVTTLILNNNYICDEGAKILAANLPATITHLELSACNIHDDGAVAIARIRSIIKLGVFQNCIDNKGGIAIATNPFITELDIRFNNIGEEGANYFLHNKTLKNILYANNAFSYQTQNKIGESREKPVANESRLFKALTYLEYTSEQLNISKTRIDHRKGG